MGVDSPGTVVEPSGKVPEWGWGSVLDNLHLNNSLTHCNNDDILHYPGKYQYTTHGKH